MTDPIFVRTRYHYDSYIDFWRLVELSQFQTCYVDEIWYDTNKTYIVTPVNGELRPHLDNQRGRDRRCKIIWWNLERPDGFHGEPGRTLTHVVDDMVRYVDAIWVSDRSYAKMDIRFTHVVLGSHQSLGNPRKPAQFDFTHQSYVYGRRECVINALCNLFSMGPNGWGDVRDHVLRSSRLMVNVHQTPAGVMEPLRFAVAAAYKLPLLSEGLADPWPLTESRDFAKGDYADGIVTAAKTILASQEWLDALGERLHERLCHEWTFRRGVEEGLQRTILERAA